MNWLFIQSKKLPHHNFINNMTFQEVFDEVQLLQSKLASFLQNESRVAIVANNSIDTILFVLALHALGKEVVMLNARLTDEEIRTQVSALQVCMVFSNHREGYIRFEDVKHFVPTYMPPQLTPLDTISFYQSDTTAIIMNTSASSGRFKSVPIRWSQIYAHVVASQSRLSKTSSDNWLLVLPLYHIGGLAILFRSLFNGTQLTLMESFDEDAVVRFIETQTVNMVSLVPTMLQRILSRIQKHRLRVVLLGGEFIPAALVNNCLEKQIPVFKSYGMTEITSQATSFSVMEHPDKIHSVGYPLDGLSIQIDKPDEHGVGEILIQGPMVLTSYVGKEATSGFFHTQDIGYIDQDNFLYILDRRDNIIISGGENIYPKEIEDVLYLLPEVSECAVVGKVDPLWGKVPVLFIVTSLSQTQVKNFLELRLAKYKLPKEFYFLTTLPKNATGKIDKKELMQLL